MNLPPWTSVLDDLPPPDLLQDLLADPLMMLKLLYSGGVDHGQWGGGRWVRLVVRSVMMDEGFDVSLDVGEVRPLVRVSVEVRRWSGWGGR